MATPPTPPQVTPPQVTPPQVTRPQVTPPQGAIPAPAHPLFVRTQTAGKRLRQEMPYDPVVALPEMLAVHLARLVWPGLPKVRMESGPEALWVRFSLCRGLLHAMTDFITGAAGPLPEAMPARPGHIPGKESGTVDVRLVAGRHRAMLVAAAERVPLTGSAAHTGACSAVRAELIRAGADLEIRPTRSGCRMQIIFDHAQGPKSR